MSNIDMLTKNNILSSEEIKLFDEKIIKLQEKMKQHVECFNLKIADDAREIIGFSFENLKINNNIINIDNNINIIGRPLFLEKYLSITPIKYFDKIKNKIC